MGGHAPEDPKRAKVYTAQRRFDFNSTVKRGACGVRSSTPERNELKSYRTGVQGGAIAVVRPRQALTSGTYILPGLIG